MQAVRYQARDGLEIPAYLTIPRGVEGRNLPVVVTPHGGPWARDMWGYDPYTQFLANRGYAVLQPNFRGSTGYGKAFLNAGNGEWGTGAMQHDITDGVKYLIDQGIADPEQVAIFGGSYGGYATLAGVAFTPDLYAAGVSYVGPSNLITLLNSIPPYWKPIKAMFDVRLGDPEDPADHERLLAQSPLFSAEQITAPLLVIQGANDPRVKKRESEQIVVALRDLGREVEYILAEDEGHGFAGHENRLAFSVAMERFLAQHLHGRYQEETSDEIGATLAALTVDVSTVVVAEAPTMTVDAATAPLPMADGSLLEPATLQYSVTAPMMGQEMVFDITRVYETGTVHGARPPDAHPDSPQPGRGRVRPDPIHRLDADGRDPGAGADHPHRRGPGGADPGQRCRHGRGDRDTSPGGGVPGYVPHLQPAVGSGAPHDAGGDRYGNRRVRGGHVRDVRGEGDAAGRRRSRHRDAQGDGSCSAHDCPRRGEASGRRRRWHG
jgi:dienelactone hydrolase